MTGFQPGKGGEGVPLGATTAAARPFDGFLLALCADIGDDYALLEAEGLLQFNDSLFEMLFPQVEVGHDLVVVQQMVLWAFDRRQQVERFIHHFQPIVELAEIELEDRIVRVLLQGLLIDSE